jgi:hypothetical protein
MEKQVVYSEGKKAFVDGKRRGHNQYRARNKELASIWWDGWDQAKKDSKREKPKIAG